MSNTTTAVPPPAPHLTDLRTHLMATLADLRNREQPMELDRALAVAKVAGTLIDSARVEVEFLKVTGQDKSAFLDTSASARIEPPASGYTLGNVERLPGVTRNTLRG